MDESYGDDVLEPLPVYEDGEPVPPAPVAGDWRLGNLFAIRRAPTVASAALGAAPPIFALPPWSIADEVRPPPVAHGGRRFSATFTRMTALNPALLADLPNWWYGRADKARVSVSPQLLLEAPSFEPSGTWRLRGSLRSPWLRRWIPVELQLWPRLGAWTKVSLEPQRFVRPGRRYFRNGHRTLDALTARLTTELRGLN
ncbi:MAG: hypothetical protein M3Q30_01545 [Actinomycetota bacterium]|nr:hypothetical protein [Actinomycetota bacterium]